MICSGWISWASVWTCGSPCQNMLLIITVYVASRELPAPVLILACSKESTTCLWMYFWNFVIWFFDTRDLIKKFLGNVVCKNVLKCMSCVARSGLCRAVCYVSVRTKEFLNKALASTDNQIREQVCIENCARPLQCVKGNTESFSKYRLRE